MALSKKKPSLSEAILVTQEFNIKMLGVITEIEKIHCDFIDHTMKMLIRIVYDEKCTRDQFEHFTQRTSQHLKAMVQNHTQAERKQRKRIEELEIESFKRMFQANT